MDVPSPVGRGPTTVATTATGARLRAAVGPGEAVFAGHYPDQPIFPAVCLAEHARLGALAHAPGPAGAWRLRAVETARFVAPVFPGDTLTIDLDWSAGPPADAAGGPDPAEWRCRATVATERGRAAQMRLRFARC